MENTITACDREALGLAARRALAYLQTVGSRQVAPSPSAVRALSQFEEPLPEAPCDAFCVLDLLDRVGSPATVATAGGRFFGFVNGAALPVSVAATWLAGAWDQNAALRVMSPAAAGAGGCGARVGPRRAGTPLGMRRVGCDRRHDGEFHRACRGSSRAARALRLGCGERRRVRSAAPDSSRRRSSPRFVAESAGPVGARPQARDPRTGG